MGDDLRGGLGERHLALVHAAAEGLPAARRAGFMRDVAARVAAAASDTALRAAISTALEREAEALMRVRGRPRRAP